VAERGDESERFHTIAGRFILASLVVLALGLCGDFYVASMMVTSSPGFSLAATIVLLALQYGLWFGYTLYKRFATH